MSSRTTPERATTPMLRLLAATLLVWLPLSGAQAMNRADATGHVSQRVDRIASADKINSWRALDNQRVFVSREKQHYLITLKHACVYLGVARNVGVTMSANTIWAGFDQITADGRYCGIKSIEQLSEGRLRELTRDI